jgi:signal-transduction protein with cAMP-binding, CBS, and nucleotidyltransferase domain
MFSERDLLVRVLAEGRDPARTAVGEVCSHEPVTVDVKQPLKEVLAVFRSGRFRHLPVVRGGLPAGILSTRDFHEYLVAGFERYIDQLKYDSALVSGADPYDHFGGGYER